jgi:hypothetical protein
MRLVPPRLAVPVTVLVLALAGCGGTTVAVQEVPGDPAQLEVPGNGKALAPETTATATPTPTETPGADDAEATAAPDTTGAAPETQQQTTPEGTTEGGTEAPSTEDSATTDQAPPAGSDAEQFEDFCAENPGAC